MASGHFAARLQCGLIEHRRTAHSPEVCCYSELKLEFFVSITRVGRHSQAFRPFKTENGLNVFENHFLCRHVSGTHDKPYHKLKKNPVHHLTGHCVSGELHSAL